MGLERSIINHALHTDLDSKLNEIAKPEGFGKSRSRKSRLRGPVLRQNSAHEGESHPCNMLHGVFVCY